MRIVRIGFILILIIVFNQGCKTLKVSKRDKKNFKTRLSIFQNGTETPIKSYSETVEINKKEFSLRFYNKKYDPNNKKTYSAQIAAFIDKSQFDKVKVGLSKSDLPYFKSGSGMATNRSGKYESLIFKNIGHHYTYYENPESKRLNLIEDSGKLPRFEFEINSLYYNNTKVKMTNTNLEEFYIAFLIDKNLNGYIDKGELNKLTIRIK